MKYIIRIFSLLLLTSNLYASECNEVLSNVLGSENKKELRQKELKELFEKHFESKADSDLHLSDIYFLKLNDKEYEYVFKRLKTSDQREFLNELSYVLWTSSLRGAKREEALGEFNLSGKYNKLYLKKKRKFNKWEKRNLKKLRKEAKGTEDKSLEQKAYLNRTRYERLAFSCSSKSVNPERLRTSKSFTRTILGAGFLSSTSGYTFANYEALIDSYKREDSKDVLEWFSKLGYDISMAIVINYVVSKVISNSGTTYLKKLLLNYSGTSAVLFTEIYSFNYLMSFFEDDDKSKRLENIFNIKDEKEFKERMEQLNELFDKIGFYRKFELYVKEYYLNLIKKEDGVINISKKYNLENITKKDLENPEVVSLIMEALAAEVYAKSRLGEEMQEPDGYLDGLIYSGSGGSDRVFFYQGTMFIYHSLNFFVASEIYRQICLNQANPLKASFLGGAVHVFWSFLYNFIEYPLRTKMINY